MFTEEELHLLSSFPKKRSVLPQRFREIYEKEYLRNRGSSEPLGFSLKRSLEGWSHRKVASITTGCATPNILEIGAGTLNHLAWEKNYHVYDAVEPMTFLYEGSKEQAKVSALFESVDQINNSDFYDKICSIFVLEHVDNLPELMANTALLMKSDGVAVHAIPSEGEWLWKLAWRSTTGLSFRFRHGLDYKILMEYEHVNNASEILDVIRLLFEDVSVLKFPFDSFPYSLYQCIVAKMPMKTRANDVLDYFKSQMTGGRVVK